jgi:Ca2+-binding EF-hand superfamily protein
LACDTYVKEDAMTRIYFFPFLIFTVLIILPLPVAIIFEAFKVNRSKILLNDRLKEKEALFLAFLCIDYQRKGYINLDQWTKFNSFLYNGQQDTTKVHRVFESLDTRNIGYMNSELFFQG